MFTCVWFNTTDMSKDLNDTLLTPLKSLRHVMANKPNKVRSGNRSQNGSNSYTSNFSLHASSSSLTSDSSSDTSPPEGYYTRLITRSDKRDVLRFLREYFFEDEPINAYLNSIQPEDVRYLDRGVYVVYCIIDEGISTMALSRSGQIVGVSLNSTIKLRDHQFPLSLCERNPIFPVIRRLLTFINRQIDSMVGWRNYNLKEMDLKMICVHPLWRRKGISQALLKQTIWTAIYNNYNKIRSVCTNTYCAKLFSNFGFDSVFQMAYKDYTSTNGSAIFVPAQPHTHVKAMTLKIDQAFIYP